MGFDTSSKNERFTILLVSYHFRNHSVVKLFVSLFVLENAVRVSLIPVKSVSISILTVSVNITVVPSTSVVRSKNK